MDFLAILSGVLAVLLAAYLAVAIAKPEIF
jgi:K+-transporting ATPase KdpF subunit